MTAQGSELKPRDCRCNRAMVFVRLIGAKRRAWWCEACDGRPGMRLVRTEATT